MDRRLRNYHKLSGTKLGTAILVRVALTNKKYQAFLESFDTQSVSIVNNYFGSKSFDLDTVIITVLGKKRGCKCNN